MSSFKPNELPIQRRLAEQVLRRGYLITGEVEFIAGPEPENHIRGCYYDPESDNLVVVYEEPIEQPVARRRAAS